MRLFKMALPAMIYTALDSPLSLCYILGQVREMPAGKVLKTFSFSSTFIFIGHVKCPGGSLLAD
jgi:hypothetical protein